MIEIKGAYGRKYKSMDDAIVAWKAGKDFKVNSNPGPYCSIRDLDRLIKDFGKVVLINGEDRFVVGQDLWGNIL